MKQNILRKKLIQIFKKNKLSESHAKIVSDYLIKAEILDASSHGLARLKMYCDSIRKKVINPSRCRWYSMVGGQNLPPQ